MPTLPRAAEVAPTPSVHRELDDVLDACAELAAQRQSPAEFYAQLSRLVSRGLAATGVAVWLHESAHRLRLIEASGSLRDPADDLRRRIEVAAANQDTARRCSDWDGGQLLVSTISPAQWMDTSWTAGEHFMARGWSTVVLLLPGDLPPSAYRMAEEVLGHVAQLAAEFHARLALAGSAAERAELLRLLDLAKTAGKSLDLKQVASIIANDGRQLLGCDRLSVLRPQGKLLATSGLAQFDRRSRAVRELEKLGRACLKWNAPVAFGDAADDTPPELSQPLEQYVETSQAKSVVAVPISLDSDAEPLALVVAEDFGGGDTTIDPHRLQELATVVAPAIHAASELDSLPMAGLLRRFRKTRPTKLVTRLALAVAIACAVAAPFVLVQRPLVVRADGELVPVEQSHIFAPQDGIVESIAVTHGKDVLQGDVLLVLRNPELELEQTRLVGERRTLESQLSAIAATRLALASSASQSMELYRLSAEEATTKQKLQSLAKREQQLAGDVAQLTIRSPRDGRVMTWQVEQQLAGRPVERGQLLLQVADPHAGWQVEFAVPDRQIGDVQQAIADNTLQLRYQLAADESAYQQATLVRVADRATESTDSIGNTTTTVALLAAPGEQASGEALQTAALRPGGQVRGRLECGDRSLGYILTRGLIRSIREWWML